MTPWWSIKESVPIIIIFGERNKPFQWRIGRQLCHCGWKGIASMLYGLPFYDQNSC